jgi:hypothetical protein
MEERGDLSKPKDAAALTDRVAYRTEHFDGHL